MAIKKYTCPPQLPSGEGSFSDNLVGFQLVAGGCFTQANFEFTTALSEKKDRTFTIGSFSDPISLNSMNIDSVEESRTILAINFRVYPNFDLSQVSNFTLYGSLSKRMSVSVTKIINFFPAALQVYSQQPNFQTSDSAFNINYDQVENETTFDINLNNIYNSFDIDFTTNSDRNFELKEIEVSPLRNFTRNYIKYSLYFYDVEYPVVYFNPVDLSVDTKLRVVVLGNPFSGNTTITDPFNIRPNKLTTNKSFNEDFDEVEKFLLNRMVVPEYTATFTVPKENEDGSFSITKETLTFPKEGPWNLDIKTRRFDEYLSKLNEYSNLLDEYRTNLISRFLTTGALKEFDTPDQKFEKILQIYGRSFDDTKMFISALSNMNSVNYNIGNDIPSQLLKNLAQTLGWRTNISPISNDELLNSVFNTGSNEFTGWSRGMTPDELNYQYYRNLILNSAYLFKSKGTRKSIEILLRLIGAPEALVEFNEHVYLADQKIDMTEFGVQYTKISGGTYVQELPVLDTTDIFSIMGVSYTGFTTSLITSDVQTTILDYPIDEDGYPSNPEFSENFFFQKGGGWFESTPQHRMPEQVDLTNSVFTGSNPNYQTILQPFNYGEEYLNRYRDFPYMDLGFRLRKTIDNNKSWSNDTGPLRNTSDGNFNSYYIAYDENLVLNVKNVDIFLNPSQGLAYDVWSMSRKYNYPIPEEGLNYIKPTYCNPNPNTPYPQRGGIDWTEIVPKPKQKTFFEFAQTFWKNTINVRNRQYINDGKTGGYPTLQSIYWRYLESQESINVPNDNFTYRTMIDYVNGLGDYWLRLVEQMVPATTIWNGGVRLENSIFHRQKFVWRRQAGCQLLPVPCNSCKITGQIFVYDCPTQFIECGLYPWNNNSLTTSFGVVLSDTLNTYTTNNGLDLNNDCLLSTLETNWYVDIRIGTLILNIYPFYTGYGLTYSNSIPTNQEWVTALGEALTELDSSGLSYFIDEVEQTVSVYNNNCIPIDPTDTLEINVGINFNILCNN